MIKKLVELLYYGFLWGWFAFALEVVIYKPDLYENPLWYFQWWAGGIFIYVLMFYGFIPFHQYMTKYLKK